MLHQMQYHGDFCFQKHCLKRLSTDLYGLHALQYQCNSQASFYLGQIFTLLPLSCIIKPQPRNGGLLVPPLTPEVMFYNTGFMHTALQCELGLTLGLISLLVQVKIGQSFHHFYLISVLGLKLQLLLEMPQFVRLEGKETIKNSVVNDFPRLSYI